MKLKIMLVVLLLPLLGYTQEKRNIMSVSAGVWGTDGGYFNRTIDYSFGPALSLEYQRILNDYMALRGKFSAGVISRKQYMETSKLVSFTAGIMLTPFGKRFRNLQIGVSPGYICNLYDSTQPAISDRDQNISETVHAFAIEFPIRFHFINNDRYVLGIGFDLITGIARSRYQIFTLQSMVSYGLKF